MKQSEASSILKMGYNVFLTGPPGSGKTFLLNQYIDYLRKHGQAVAITASTGIAATHIGGITLHSWSGLGIKDSVTDADIRSLVKKPYLRKRIKHANVLIIDEISMLKASQFEAVDRICQYFKTNFAPFGGMQVICSGDFFQLPPIDRNNGEIKFAVESYSWKNMDVKICYLEEQFRQKDKVLSDLLNNIRENNVEASKKILAGNVAGSAQPFGAALTKLYTHNADVDAINDFELSKIGGQEFVHQMTFTGQKEVVDILKRSCLAPERLVLKRGAQVMFIKNNFDAGYVNGTQGTVVDFDENSFPIVKTFTGQTVTAKYAGWSIEEENKVVAQINQIPLRLAWAITVHKSQGMNLDAAQIDLSKCFIEGMGYVAISRLRSFAGLKIIGINDLAFSVHEKAIDMDRDFREDSQLAVQALARMDKKAITRKQKEFLKSLAEA